jgi:AcrR family transcriptional regulator
MAFMSPSTAPPQAGSRERRKSARRGAILDAARKVFAEKGYDGATIADIAREAGVAAGTLYLYYESKVDLFAALNARLFEVINDAMRASNAPPDLRGGTAARIHAVFEACGDHRDLLHLVFLNPDPRLEASRRMRSSEEKRISPLADVLRQGMEAGLVRSCDPKQLARLTVGVVIAGLYQCFVQGDGRDVRTYESIVTEMIVGGLRPAANN